MKVSFTDDSGNSETLTSVATAEVEAAPLTAEMRNVPESHNGQNTFTLRILFSEPVTVGYQALKEDSFEISNGTITRARRVNGRNDLRQFTVRPSSNRDVVIVLPADRPCDDEGAICTSDGKRLSNRLKLTVPGPAAANAPATGAPTISGTAQVGQTLTATTSNIADSDGLVNAVYGYQWVRNDGGTDAEIQGATGSIYTLDAADEGKTVKVRVSFTDDAGNEETLTSAGTAAVEARPNSPATGVPTISGTAQVGETLTADTSGIADDNGLTGVSYSYQWTRSDTSISGATGATYTVVRADGGHNLKVTVSFTDDDGYDESVTSAAVEIPRPPLTAELIRTNGTPANHDGSSTFTVQLDFSESFDISYTTVRDHALDVTGGTVLNAARVNRTGDERSRRWSITVRPDGNDDVQLALTPTTDCSAEDAICTPDGRMLSSSLSMTIAGSP